MGRGDFTVSHWFNLAYDACRTSSHQVVTSANESADFKWSWIPKVTFFSSHLVTDLIFRYIFNYNLYRNISE